jgi:CMP/dCMP kinase
MTDNSPFMITISRQLGSGGAYLGRRLATRLNILYLDREILFQAAKELKISETELDSLDEKVIPRWQSWLQIMAQSYSLGFAPPMIDVPTDQKLFNAESDVIKRTSQEHSAVIVGRAGSYILREHPRHLSIFLYADVAFRQQRLQELNNVSAQEALKLINRIDRARTQYLRVFTGQDWMNACQYHLCLDTSVVGLERAEDIILATVQARLGIMVS